MILVTGATGFLGSVLTRNLIEQGESVRALKRSNSKIPEFLQNKKNVEWVEGDVNDLFSLEAALEGITQVYHTAATISFQPKDKANMLRTNVEGTANLVNLCLEKPHIRMLHVSSVAALGKAKAGQLIDENTFWDDANQPSAYALSKHLSEMEVWRGIAEGLDALIVNPSIIIGKECGWKGSGSLFSTVDRGLSRYPLGSCGLVTVTDVAMAMIQLMKSSISAERFVLNGENWLYKDLFQEIARQFGTKGPQKEVKEWQLLLAASVLQWVGRISGKTFGLTKETARSASKISEFSTEKIKKAIDFQFSPIRQSIAEICHSLK